jgi:hypothetical protein
MNRTAADTPDDRALWDALLGIFACPSILVARDLGLYSALREAPRTIEELSSALGIATRPIRLLLEVHVAARLLEPSGDRFGLTPLARAYLLPDSPTYFGGFLDLVAIGAPMYTYDGLKRAVAADAPSLGSDVFDVGVQDPAFARALTGAMHSMSVAPARAWPRVCDFEPRVLLDIGGGSGIHAIAAAQHWPSLEAVVLELPSICELAAETITAYEMSGRVRTAGGNMWTDALPRADTHFYSQIFHDWPLTRCALLAKRSFEHLPAGGRIIVHEMLFDEGKTGPLAIAGMSLSALFGTQGEQYSGAEIARLLSEAGFVDVSISPTFGYWSIVTGRRAA